MLVRYQAALHPENSLSTVKLQHIKAQIPIRFILKSSRSGGVYTESSRGTTSRKQAIDCKITTYQSPNSNLLYSQKQPFRRSSTENNPGTTSTTKYNDQKS